MHRKHLFTIVFSTIFFVCFLGVRNPWLHDNHRPKAHPRAIIDENANKVEEISKSYSLDVEAAHAETVLTEPPCFRFFDTRLPHESSPVDIRQFIARAPPVAVPPQS